ncbi:hypothetical protein [Flavobacterium urocaniciphilum]|uniref:Integral membrane protein n=1 Tax=Flavobacterium urocaniciphilum TaxID=1299341 RepID=A0A1H9C8I1_9FLAO|nr:hypothetical protein [Flavobacterium urocaniciphilum]SEP97472.1 hypothetical protein SAMN05444005_104101 [Flavobacterium urocaniciphilum]
MNLNIIGYILYLSITSLIILKVGKLCYNNGNIFVSQLIPDHLELCHQINKMLLIGYYLLNLGYCAMTIISWEQILTFNQLIEIIATKSAIIILTIGFMHYINIILLTKYIKKLI